MTKVQEVRPTARGGVIGLGLGQFRFVGSGVALLAAVLALAPSVLAGPTGGTVVAGQGNIVQHGNRTVITASNGAIFNFTSFNVNRNETVKFVQPGSTARVLNRITSADPSMINGHISSNGIVYFANPAGVIFGPNSVLNVGGIYAAAGNISNSDFMRGLNHFTDVKGTVVNQGVIEGGTVALIGDKVLNSGTITSPKGLIAMVAGTEVTLSERGGTMTVKVDAASVGQTEGAAVENTGTLNAERGSALMVAGDMYSLAVKSTGTVRAKDIRVEGRGKAGVSVSGTLDASNQRGNGKGGSVTVTGQTVELTGATVNASGRREGGSIRVGGDYQGSGDLARATTTSVDSKTTLNADATDSGNGGSVVVWSDHTTSFYGTASASGGVKGGDGGFIETSGKINLDIRGASVQAHARAAGGKSGLWLMDPVNVNIDDPTGGDDTTGGTFTAGQFDPDNSASPAVVDVNTINAALNAGTNVTILTGSVGTDAGNITVNAAVSKTAGTDATLTLNAANNIDVNATIGSTVGQLGVDLQGGGAVTVNSAITTNGGAFASSGTSFTETAAGSIVTAGGNIGLNHSGAVSFSGTNTTGGGAFASNGTDFAVTSTGAVTTNSGNMTLTNTGATSINGTVVTNSGAFGAAGTAFTIGSTGSLTTNSGNVALTNSGLTTVDGAVVTNGGTFSSGGSGFSMASTGSLMTFGGNVTLTPSGMVTLGGSIATNGGTFTSTSNDFTLSNGSSLTTISGGVTLTASQSTINGTLNSGTGLFTANGSYLTVGTTGSVASTGAMISLGGDVIVDGSLNAGAGGVLSSGSGFTVHSTGSVSALGVTLNHTGNVVLEGTVAAGSGAFNSTGDNFTIGSGGSVTSTGATMNIVTSVVLGGTLDAGSGAISVTGGLPGISGGGPITGSSASFTSGGFIQLSGLNISGAITAMSVGNTELTGSTGLTLASGSSIGGDLTLHATTGNIDVQTTAVAGTEVHLETDATDATIHTVTLAGAKNFNLTTHGSGGDATVAASGLMSIAADVAGTLKFSGGAGVTIASVPTLHLGDSTSNGFLTITAPDVDVVGSVFAGSAGIILQPDTDGATIGINSSGASFSLTAAELNALHTSGTVTVGRATGTGAITVGGLGATDLSASGWSLTLRGGATQFMNTLTLANDQTLTLLAAGVSGQGMGTDVVIGGDGRLVVDSTAAVGLTTNLAKAAIRSSAGAITLHNLGALEIASLGMIDGVSTAPGADITITAENALTLSSAVASGGAGHVTLRSVSQGVAFGTGSSATTGNAGTVTVSAATDITAPSDATPVITAGTVDLTATTGGIGGMDTLKIDASTLTAAAGGNVDITSVGTGTLDASIAGSATSVVSLTHAGLLSIASGHSVTGDSIRLAAHDLDLAGTIVSGNLLTLTRDTAGTIGVGDATGDLAISKAELARITAATLVLGDNAVTGITATNVAASDLATVSNVRLEALADGGDVTFSGAASTFKNLTVRADDSIQLVSSLTVATGGLTLLADADGMTDAGGDKITIADAVVLSTSSPSGGDIVLTASGGIAGAGAVLIDSNGALTINDTVTAATSLTLRALGGITLNGAGSGTGVTLTANDGITINNDLSSGTNPLLINADADANGTGTFTVGMAGQINTTNVNVTVTAADAQIDGQINVGTGTVALSRATSGTIGLGSASGDMQLSGAEIGNIHSTVLALGNALTTGINVDGVSASDTSHITGLITFLTDNVSITGAFNTGSAGLAIGRGTTGDIAVGSAVGSFLLDSTELALITTSDLQIGGGATRNIFVNGVASGDTANVSGTTTFLADNSVQFIAAPSTFKALTVRAKNGIKINVNLTTTVGNMDLDADTNGVDDGTDDLSDAITIASGRTLDSAGSLVLRANNGHINGIGGLTLLANNGVSVFHDLTTGGTTTIDADHNADGAGDLLVSSGRTIATSGSDLSITAADITLDGLINTAQGAATITRAAAGTIGLGTATGDMTLSGMEMGHIVSQGLTVGGAPVTGITVDGVTATNSNGVVGTVTLIAGAGGITFSGTASTFNALDAQASGAILVSSVLATDAGKLRLDSDTDHSGNERITLSANITADIPPSSGNPTVAFNIDLASDVFLGSNVVVTGRDVKFRGDIDSANATARQLTINTFQNGVTSLLGDIGTVNRLFQLATNNDGITQLGGTIKTSGAVGFSDAVRLVADTIIDVQAGQGVLFNSTVDSALQSSGNHSLTILMTRGSAPAAVNFPLISFAGNVGALKPLNNLWLNYDGTLAGNGRENTPAIATIFARPRDSSGTIQTNPTTPYSVSFNTTGEFRMGRNEKFTSGGRTTINAGSAVLGDVNSVGDLTVNSPSISIVRRDAGKVSGKTGLNALDQGVDIVSGGTVNFTSTPTLAGSGPDPRFGTPNGGGDVSGTLSNFIFQARGTLNPDEINGTGGDVFRTLDLLSSGPTNTNIANTIAGAIPRETRQNDVGEQTTLAQAQFEQVKQLGIVPRNATAGELIELLTGSATYDDYPRQLLPVAEDYTTVVNRLPSDRVEALLTSYDAVFNTVEVDDTGKPVTDEQGKTRRVSRTQEIQEALLASVKRFREASKIKATEIDPLAFRAYLEQTPDESKSLNYVRQLGEFLVQLELVGLTQRELSQSKAIILNPVRPRGIRNVQQFEAVIKGNPARASRE
jgi:filamentous hemagglutinin family protein